jgi:hypothetical protein
MLRVARHRLHMWRMGTLNRTSQRRTSCTERIRRRHSTFWTFCSSLEVGAASATQVRGSAAASERMILTSTVSLKCAGRLCRMITTMRSL